MMLPIEKTSSKTDVMAAQAFLNKLGCLLTVDGIYGEGCREAVDYAYGFFDLPKQEGINSTLWLKLESYKNPSDLLSTDGLTFIAKEEVSSRELYEKKYSSPTLPSSTSGMTIGIGYDLQFCTEKQFLSDWGDKLPGADIDLLKTWIGKVGTPEGVTALKCTKQPFEAAWNVFCNRTIPLYVDRTSLAFPGFRGLPIKCRTALVSLVYNRGTSMRGESRIEMLNIRTLIENKKYSEVPDQFRSMKRLWPNLPGLRRRRDFEADLWVSALEDMK